MTIVYTYAASDNSRNRRKARRAAQRQLETVPAKQPASRVIKACISVPVRHSGQVAGSMCLPEVAMFAAGFRKSENITAR